MHCPISHIHAECENNQPIRYPITAKLNNFYRQADRRGGGGGMPTSRTTTIGSFSEKKNYKK